MRADGNTHAAEGLDHRGELRFRVRVLIPGEHIEERDRMTRVRTEHGDGVFVERVRDRASVKCRPRARSITDAACKAAEVDPHDDRAPRLDRGFDGRSGPSHARLHCVPDLRDNVGNRWVVHAVPVAGREPLNTIDIADEVDKWITPGDVVAGDDRIAEVQRELVEDPVLEIEPAGVDRDAPDLERGGKRGRLAVEALVLDGQRWIEIHRSRLGTRGHDLSRRHGERGSPEAEGDHKSSQNRGHARAVTLHAFDRAPPNPPRPTRSVTVL